MIEIKAKTETSEDGVSGVNTSVSIEGYNDDIIAEALASISGMMQSLRKMDEDVYMMVLIGLNVDKDIFRGEESTEEDDRFKVALSKAMSKSIVREGELN